MRSRPIAMLLMLAASQAVAQPAPQPQLTATAVEGLSVPGKRIFLPPPLLWDSAMLSYRPALEQTAADFATLTGGLGFGMSPAALNATLPNPYPALSWNNLALAIEFPGEARFFGIPVAASGKLQMDVAACTGAGSYVVFVFNARGLIRISYRLATDQGCADTSEAAQQIYARYVPLGTEVAHSMRYQTGTTQVVDITDPTGSTLTAIRWRQVGN